LLRAAGTSRVRLKILARVPLGGLLSAIDSSTTRVEYSPFQKLKIWQNEGNLNNILKQDHRAIKRRVKDKQSFREFRAARRTIEGYEAMHMIRKGQARWVSDADVRKQNLFIDQLFDLAA
jgi:hypothetical protein